MKKITASLIVLVLCFSQCKKETASGEAKTELKSNDAQSVSDILKFNNEFLRASESRSSYLDQLSSYLDGAERKANGENVVVLIKPTHVSIGVGKMSDVPDGYGDSKAEIKKNTALAEEKFLKIKENVEHISNYLSAEDFKDDKGAKFRELKSLIDADIKSYYAAYDAAMNKIKPISMAAEEEALKDHPLKKEIISAKKSLAAVDEIVAELTNQLEAKKYDEAKFSALYANLEKAAAETAGIKMEVKEPMYQHKVSAFERYNKSLESFTGAFRKFMRDSKASDGFNEDAINAMENPYKDVVRSYNSFVD